MSMTNSPNSDKLTAYIQLMRADRPIGTYLLLWPTLWALWIAAEGVPPLHLLVIFSLGVFLTRSAGCVINDYADRHFDGHVKRTKERPMPTGRVTEREALWLFAGLMLGAFALVLFTNGMTVLMSIAALALAFSYPFMKRHTHLPQVVLGAAFGWAIPMAFTAVQEQLPLLAWLIFMAKIFWTVAYDSMYAMVDRDDDLLIGIKSTAVLFGHHDRLIIGLLQVFTLVLLIGVGLLAGLGIYFYIGLAGAASLFIYQQWLIRERERMPCLKAFLNNHWAELLVLIGIIADYALR
ncbi:4-hydroxybenzoate polyprenyltransferase [Marinobacterium lacunae]|uniref:4-hydroxybenzoate octaprenyltransferase n=2 Tax=Marinobacterium lacunae TaxID=1232683 RepID=A0A081FV67_9GAMM|nr:4-hydroxybenzoate polyprenyltransferase [Marinobacterium lacunae]